MGVQLVLGTCCMCAGWGQCTCKSAKCRLHAEPGVEEKGLKDDEQHVQSLGCMCWPVLAYMSRSIMLDASNSHESTACAYFRTGYNVPAHSSLALQGLTIHMMRTIPEARLGSAVCLSQAEARFGFS
eukprot:1160581-Pelagomonas_calceolata.AAC.13